MKVKYTRNRYIVAEEGERGRGGVRKTPAPNSNFFILSPSFALEEASPIKIEVSVKMLPRGKHDYSTAGCVLCTFEIVDGVGEG